MKILLQTLFFFLLVTQICFGQWYEQYSGTTQHLNKVQFVNTNTGWAVGDSGLILHTSNGGSSWIQQSSGIQFPITDVVCTDASTGWVLGSGYIWASPVKHNILLKTTNGGATWIQQINDTTCELDAICFINQNTGWIAGTGGISPDSVEVVLMKTIDGGNSWFRQPSPWSGNYENSYVVNLAICFIDSLAGYVVTGSGWGWIIKTTDGGETWDKQLFDVAWRDIAFSDGQNGIAIGNQRPSDRRHRGVIYRTTNGGGEWQQVFEGNWDTYCDDVFVGNSNVITVVGSHILRSIDSGTSWLIDNSFSRRLHGVSFVDDYVGWAVGDDGTILHTTNGGVVPVELNSFTALANGKEVTLIWSTSTELNNQSFEIQRKFGNSDFVTIGSVKGHGTTTSPNNYTYIDRLIDAGKYFYRLKQIDFGGKYEYSQTVEVNWSPFTTYKLEQNYPNPFNPTTTIGFGIPNKGNVKLSILNVLGEEIRVLLNEEKEAGYHSIDFNASELPSGVYFYQLKAGEFVQTRKMVLMK